MSRQSYAERFMQRASELASEEKTRSGAINSAIDHMRDECQRENEALRSVNAKLTTQISDLEGRILRLLSVDHLTNEFMKGLEGNMLLAFMAALNKANFNSEKVKKSMKSFTEMLQEIDTPLGRFISEPVFYGPPW